MPAAGHKQSAEARERIAAARRKYWAGVRAGKQTSRAGHHMREEAHRVRASERARQWAQDHPEHAPNLGRRFDEQWRASMAEAHRGYVMPAEQRRRIGASCKGKTLGKKKRPEAIEKMRLALLAKGEAASSKRPEVRAKLSRAHGGHNKKQTKPEALLHAALDTARWKYIGAGYLADGTTNGQYDGRLSVPVGADFVCFLTKTLVFLDGCYWHECPEHGSGRFPDKPAKDKVLRDRARQCGWNVVSIWEHDVRTDATAVAQLLERTGKKWRPSLRYAKKTVRARRRQQKPVVRSASRTRTMPTST